MGEHDMPNLTSLDPNLLIRHVGFYCRLVKRRYHLFALTSKCLHAKFSKEELLKTILFSTENTKHSREGIRCHGYVRRIVAHAISLDTTWQLSVLRDLKVGMDRYNPALYKPMLTTPGYRVKTWFFDLHRTCYTARTAEKTRNCLSVIIREIVKLGNLELLKYACHALSSSEASSSICYIDEAIEKGFLDIECLHTAAKYARFDVLNWFYHNCNSQFFARKGRLVYHAATSGNRGVVELCYDWDMVDRSPNAPVTLEAMEVAIRNGDFEMLMVFLGHGDINFETCTDYNWAEIAVRNNSQEILRVLICNHFILSPETPAEKELRIQRRHDSNPRHLTDKDMMTLALPASQCSSMETLHLLSKHGYDQVLTSSALSHKLHCNRMIMSIVEYYDHKTVEDNRVAWLMDIIGRDTVLEYWYDIVPFDVRYLYSSKFPRLIAAAGCEFVFDWLENKKFLPPANTWDDFYVIRHAIECRVYAILDYYKQKGRLEGQRENIIAYLDANTTSAEIRAYLEANVTAIGSKRRKTDHTDDTHD